MEGGSNGRIRIGSSRREGCLRSCECLRRTPKECARDKMVRNRVRLGEARPEKKMRTFEALSEYSETWLRRKKTTPEGEDQQRRHHVVKAVGRDH